MIFLGATDRLRRELAHSPALKPPSCKSSASTLRLRSPKPSNVFVTRIVPPASGPCTVTLVVATATPFTVHVTG